uniref:Polyketide synthase n=1 Tax=Peronospora matthiolae TaxID=2874970 RepID=A0AAV1UL44_9STRA
MRVKWRNSFGSAGESGPSRLVAGSRSDDMERLRTSPSPPLSLSGQQPQVAKASRAIGEATDGLDMSRRTWIANVLVVSQSGGRDRV